MQQIEKILRHRVTLIEKRWKELDDGSFCEELIDLGMVWARLAPTTSESLEKQHEWHKNKGKPVIGLYQVDMRKYFSCNARHAKINALRFEHRVLDILYPLRFDENGYWLTGIAADYRRERRHG